MQVLHPSAATCLQTQASQQDAPVAQAFASHDFDFLAGSWIVQHRKLKHRLTHSDEWEIFSGTCDMRMLLGGAANVDDNVLNTPEGMYRAASLRAFDAVTKKWSIWWLDGRHHPGQLDPPVTGEFRNGVGLFFGDDTWNGEPIKVRFMWSDITPNSARWQQAFSADGGKRWETNWVMDFRRASSPPVDSPTAKQDSNN
jgi:hypothetical protein